jgi:hypothetical protein
MSGVFSMASHWALQYFSDFVTHEQIGCAHLWVFVVFICFLLVSDQQALIQRLHISCWDNMLLCRKEHTAKLVAYFEAVRETDSLACEPDDCVFRCEQTANGLRAI